jgi:hypothetical protein
MCRVTPIDPATLYTGSYSTNAVNEHYWSWASWSYEWRLFAYDINDLNCTSIKEDLLATGYAEGNIRSTTFSCGGWAAFTRWNIKPVPR